MLFQEIQDSPWLITFGVSASTFVVVMWVIVGLAYRTKNPLKPRTLRRMFWGAGACVFVCTLGLVVALNHQNDQINVSFRKQLMDEYHAASSRSFDDIDYDSKTHNVATTVLTRDGKDTPVFIQIVKRDGKEITMTFHVVDDNSLYPKASE